jgi:hypothetical protein
MASAKKLTRDELIGHGCCPDCSKYPGQSTGGRIGMLYACSRCGTLLLEFTDIRNNPEVFGHHNLPNFVDVTEYWDEIKNRYDNRLEEIRDQADQLEIQLQLETLELIKSKIADAGPRPLTLVKR